MYWKWVAHFCWLLDIWQAVDEDVEQWAREALHCGTLYAFVPLRERPKCLTLSSHLSSRKKFQVSTYMHTNVCLTASPCHCYVHSHLQIGRRCMMKESRWEGREGESSRKKKGSRKRLGATNAIFKNTWSQCKHCRLTCSSGPKWCILCGPE